MIEGRIHSVTALHVQRLRCIVYLSTRMVRWRMCKRLAYDKEAEDGAGRISHERENLRACTDDRPLQAFSSFKWSRLSAGYISAEAESGIRLVPMKGYQVLKHLRVCCNRCPIVFVQDG